MVEQEKDSKSGWQEVVEMMKRHPVFSLVILLLIAGGLLVFFLRSSQATASSKKEEAKKEEEKKLPVEVVTVRRGSISSWLTTTTTLEADRQVTVVSETTGIVDRVLAEEGAFVKEGEVLAILSDNQKEVDFQKAILRVQNARLELNRKEASYREKIISQAEYDKARFELEVAESEKKGAEVALQRLTIRAPFSGVITERLIEKGQNIAIGTQLFTIVDRDPLEAKIYLPEKEIFGIKQNQIVDLSLNSQKDVKFHGRIRQINPAVDPKTGTVKVTIEVQNPPAEVRPGSFVDVRLITQHHDNVLLVPKKALMEDATEKSVYIIHRGIAFLRLVEVGFTDDEMAEITSGLKEGDQVVVAGQGGLREGSKTEIIARK